MNTRIEKAIDIDAEEHVAIWSLQRDDGNKGTKCQI